MDINSYLNSMMAYWGPMMDIALERAGPMAEREEIAFDQYVRDKRLDRELGEEDVLRSKADRKADKRARSSERFSMSAAEPGSSGREGGGDSTRGIRDMMTVRTDLDTLEDPFHQGFNYGTNRNFRNIPAAAALTGLNLPTSGFDTYSNIAGAGSRQSAAAEGAASDWRLWDPKYGGGSLRGG
jgi:hypothetical protein